MQGLCYSTRFISLEAMMELFENGSIQLELKYCERCGALWLRPTSSELVFCAACATVMAGFAPNSRFLKQHCPTPQDHARARRIQAAFWGEGGNA